MNAFYNKNNISTDLFHNYVKIPLINCYYENEKLHPQHNDKRYNFSKAIFLSITITMVAFDYSCSTTLLNLQKFYQATIHHHDHKT